jgi:hypothetical protein
LDIAPKRRQKQSQGLDKRWHCVLEIATDDATLCSLWQDAIRELLALSYLATATWTGDLTVCITASCTRILSESRYSFYYTTM